MKNNVPKKKRSIHKRQIDKFSELKSDFSKSQFYPTFRSILTLY